MARHFSPRFKISTYQDSGHGARPPQTWPEGASFLAALQPSVQVWPDSGSAPEPPCLSC